MGDQVVEGQFPNLGWRDPLGRIRLRYTPGHQEGNRECRLVSRLLIWSSPPGWVI